MIDSAADLVDPLAVQQMRSFCVVYEKQSYAAAARELGLTAPTIWQQVRTLESRAQTPLFVRRGRRIEPTPAAAVLHQSLRPLLTGLDTTFQSLRDEAAGQVQKLTLVTGARMMLEDLGRPLQQFCARFPQVSLRLMHDHSGNAEALVMSGQADLALTLEPGPGLVAKGLNSERAYPIDYLALLPRRHPLARKRELRLADLASYPLILGHAQTYGRQLLEQAMHHDGLLSQMRVVAETDTSAFTIGCVRANMGIGIVAGRRRGWLTRDLVVRPLTAQLGQAWIAFLWKRGRHMTASLQALMQLIRAAVESAGGKSKK